MVQKALRGITTANLRSLRFLSHPDRLLQYLRDLEGAYQPYRQFPIASVELADILGKDFAEPLFLPLGHVRAGSSPAGDLSALAAITKKKRPKSIFEIGTFEGLSTVVFVKNAATDVVVHTLDLPHGQPDITRTSRSFRAHSISGLYASGNLIDKFGVREQTHAYWGDSAVFDFSPFNSAVDIFFVDGAHTEDYVASDSLHAFECISTNGWVLWHDCFTPQVLNILKQIAEVTTVHQIRGTNLALAMGRPSSDVLARFKRIAALYHS